MAASDLDDLNNFEVHFESSSVTFLNDDVGIDVFRTVIEDNIVTPRIEVQFFVGDANQPFAPRNGGGSPTTLDYRSFAGTFQARLITDNATGGADDHATYRSKMRTSLMRSGANWYGGGGSSSGLTGTASISSGTSTLTGVGTSFESELIPGDSITVGGTAFIVASITSDTVLTTASAAASTITGGALTKSASNLQYYDVKHLQPAACEYETDGDMNVSTLNYDLVWEIRDDAWP